MGTSSTQKQLRTGSDKYSAIVDGVTMISSVYTSH